MDRDKNNRKIAEWLGVPCWHEQDIWHCKKCQENLYEVEKATGRVNPDYYTPEGFFALLDGLRAKGLESDLCQKLSDNEWAVDIWIYESPSVPDIIATAQRTDLPTALVDATLQAMKVENG